MSPVLGVSTVSAAVEDDKAAQMTGRSATRYRISFDGAQASGKWRCSVSRVAEDSLSVQRDESSEHGLRGPTSRPSLQDLLEKCCEPPICVVDSHVLLEICPSVPAHALCLCGVSYKVLDCFSYRNCVSRFRDQPGIALNHNLRACSRARRRADHRSASGHVADELGWHARI